MFKELNQIFAYDINPVFIYRFKQHALKQNKVKK